MTMSQPPVKKPESLASALAALQANRPLRAEEICRDYLLLNPGCKDHIRLLSHALMKQGRLKEAEDQVRFALSMEPKSPLLLEDLGSIFALQDRFAEAIPWFEAAIKHEPTLPLVHKKLGQALAALGKGKEADQEFREYLELDTDKGLVASAVEQMQAGRFDEAVTSLKNILRDNPENVDAMRYLAGIYYSKKLHLDDAEALLRHATQLAPGFVAAWMLLGPVLMERAKFLDAIAAFGEATRLAPQDAEAWGGLGNAHARASNVEESVQAFARSVALDPNSPGIQMGYAHVLKTIGDQAGALQAYRAAIREKPGFGEVYWSMANLKVFKFEKHEVTAMEQQLERDDLKTSPEIHFRFALGKAYEDRRDYDRAWHYYHSGNELQRTQIQYDLNEFELRQAKIMEVFSREFLAARAGQGCKAADPIFIVGLPRSGSTLIEQILASHSQVEGTAELPILSKIASSIGRYRRDNVQYPQAVRDLRAKDLTAYGEQYLEDTRRHRATDRPYFTDKLPNNFSHIGLVSVILPNARIINTRRHPMDSCLGAYKQLFGQGQNFTYDMFEIAEYYRQYHALMTHWHSALPGKILDVHYEETVTDLEGQVRRVLEFCGLPFEHQCLKFYTTERAVKTASSEQVRQPIYRGALGKWRRYERHLGVWQEVLDDIVRELPETVRNAGL
ncbi:MAG: sulfotransferase family protein [Xanthomonadales bacterium]|nr:sulfotransferase family protein [Xanthomonadales bacterium]